MVVKKADFELERIDKACGKQEKQQDKNVALRAEGNCQQLTDVFKSDEYKQCVNSLEGKWQTPLTFLGGNANPNKDVPEAMCKNDACQKYISKVKSINADNCPFSHRGIDMVVKKADFELERIDKACGFTSDTKSTAPTTASSPLVVNAGTTKPSTPLTTPSFREGSTPAPTKQSSSAAAPLHIVVSSALLLSVGGAMLQ
ncbi:hypothetical protein P43SY_003274 [Pythium insidiosum]|uniref:Elicitin n=1 Tax=Pythium insidiosum TaxID=114742 RepID=A0AAD5LY22_PYTIN|nr:hypothetical protein P43SY_003274 [Pythium insidiosum]